MFGRAINYALSACNHLLNYLDCPELFVDNSIAERSIKPFVIGRKNWLFSGSETGAENSCFLFTLIENAKLYKLDPYEFCVVFLIKHHSANLKKILKNYSHGTSK